MKWHNYYSAGESEGKIKEKIREAYKETDANALRRYEPRVLQNYLKSFLLFVIKSVLTRKFLLPIEKDRISNFRSNFDKTKRLDW